MVDVPNRATLRGFHVSIADIGDQMYLCHPLLSFEDDTLYFAYRLDWRDDPGMLTVADPREASVLGTLLPPTCKRTIASGKGVVAVGGKLVQAATDADVKILDPEIGFVQIDGSNCWIGVAEPDRYEKLRTKLAGDALVAFDKELPKAVRSSDCLSKRGNAALFLIRKCGPRRRKDLAIRQLVGAWQNGELDLYQRLLVRFEIELGEKESILHRQVDRHRTNALTWWYALPPFLNRLSDLVSTCLARSREWVSYTGNVCAAWFTRLVAASREDPAEPSVSVPPSPETGPIGVVWRRLGGVAALAVVLVAFGLTWWMLGPVGDGGGLEAAGGARNRSDSSVASAPLPGIVTQSLAAALSSPASGQSKLGAGIERALSEIGNARVLVTMTAPGPGEASSAAYREPVGFVTDLLGERGGNVQRIVDLPVVVVETDRRGISDLVGSPHVAQVAADEPAPPLLGASLKTLRVDELHSANVLGTGYSVAVLDTGVDYDLPSFGGKLRAEGCFSTATSDVYSVRSLCGNGLDVDLTEGAGRDCDLLGCDHGTHVARIAVGARVSVDGDAISSVAPGAGLISIQVFTEINDVRECGVDNVPCIRSFPSDQVRALRYVMDLSASHEIASVSMSVGGYHNAACDSANPLTNDILTLRESGILAVIASGNDRYYNAVKSLACIPAAMIVADGYGPNTGTSLAAGQVAGLVALLRSQVPSASADEIESALRRTAQRTIDPRTGLVLYFPGAPAALAALVSTTRQG